MGEVRDLVQVQLTQVNWEGVDPEGSKRWKRKGGQGRVWTIYAQIKSGIEFIQESTVFLQL